MGSASGGESDGNEDDSDRVICLYLEEKSDEFSRRLSEQRSGCTFHLTMPRIAQWKISLVPLWYPSRDKHISLLNQRFFFSSELFLWDASSPLLMHPPAHCIP